MRLILDHRRIVATARLVSTNRHRFGATMLELLAVIVVLLMITTATVPVVAPHAEGRRIREGARMLSTFINAGRTRAIETGRPTGVWIERMPNLPEAANMVYFAEIPPIYAGDFLDSTAECCAVSKQNSSVFTWPTHSDQEYYNIVIPRNRTAYLTDIWAIPPENETSVGGHQLVRERDQIRFEGIDRLYTLNVVKDLSVAGSNQRTWWYILKGVNANTPSPSSYSNQCDLLLRYVIHWFTGPNGTGVGDGLVVRTTTAPLTFASTGLRYQIYRQPVRLQAGSIRMPEGVVIDLNFSSVTNGTRSDSGTPFHPRLNGGNFLGDPVYPKDNTPIVFVFTPDGQMQRIYRQTVDSNSRWSWESTEPVGSVFLLVGERKSITPHENTVSSNLGLYDEQVKKNWCNLNALWVRVNCQTGFTSTALVDNLTTTAQTQNPDANLYLTRAKAHSARTVGGR